MVRELIAAMAPYMLSMTRPPDREPNYTANLLSGSSIDAVNTPSLETAENLSNMLSSGTSKFLNIRNPLSIPLLPFLGPQSPIMIPLYIN